MNLATVSVLLFTTMLTFSALYLPQPLLPVFTDIFKVSKSTAALATTFTMIPLAVAPLMYGVLLEKFSSRKILIAAVLTLAISEFAIALTPGFTLLLVLRLVQGLLLPAMMTSLMTYISGKSDVSRVQRYMALYVAAQISGGFLGRAISGIIAQFLGWRYSFAILGISLLAAALLLKLFTGEAEMKRSSLTPGAILEVVKRPVYRYIYLSIFFTFFVFASLLNFLPFRLTEIGSGIGSMGIGFMYTGFMMGILVSLKSASIISRFKGEMKTVLAAQAVLVAAVILFLIPYTAAAFASMFPLCAGMFLTHAVSSGYLNRLAKERKGIVNGTYVAFYYTGGSLGTYLPGFIFNKFGWAPFSLSLIVIAFLGILSSIRAKKLIETGM